MRGREQVVVLAGHVQHKLSRPIIDRHRADILYSDAPLDLPPRFRQVVDRRVRYAEQARLHLQAGRAFACRDWRGGCGGRALPCSFRFLTKLM